MQAITLRSIKAESHPETKGLFWHLFVGTKGGNTRVRIVNQLRSNPSNKNQLSQDLGMDYKGIGHHMKILEQNNMVVKVGSKYGATYFISSLFEESQAVFDEIVDKLKKIGEVEWLR